MDLNQNIDICGTSLEIFNDSNPVKQYKMQIYANEPEILGYLALLSCPFAHPSIAFRTSSLLKILKVDENENYENLYSENVGSLEDYELWLRLLFPENDQPKMTLCNISTILVKHRKHATNVSTVRQKVDMGKEVEIKVELFKKILGESVTELIDIALVDEYVRITGRNLSNDDLYTKVMTSLKFKS